MSEPCPACQQLEWRLKRSINLHTQTACQLANTEADLVDTKKQIRQLQAQIRDLEKLKGVSCS